MTLWSSLLRVLVCLCLVIQGTQSAFAATDMGAQHAAQALNTMTSHATVPCHTQGMPMAAHAPASKATRGFAGSGHPKPDCCQHASCTCACAQFAIADVRLYAALPIALPPQRILLPMDDGLPAPVLPHLIRPPIG